MMREVEMSASSPSFVTNFSGKYRHVYEKAIAKHGDSRFVIREPESPCTDGGSLHYLGPKRDDLGPFWKVFHSIKGRAA